MQPIKEARLTLSHTNAKDLLKCPLAQKNRTIIIEKANNSPLYFLFILFLVLPFMSIPYVGLCISCWDVQAFSWYDVIRLFWHNLQWIHYFKMLPYLLMYSIHGPYCSLHNDRRNIICHVVLHSSAVNVPIITTTTKSLVFLLLGHQQQQQQLLWLTLNDVTCSLLSIAEASREGIYCCTVSHVDSLYTIQALFCHCVCVCLCAGFGLYVCYQPEDDY